MACDSASATNDNRNMTDNEFALTVGWGQCGSTGTVMSGQGRVVERTFTPVERIALADAFLTLGETAYDIYLNDHTFWRTFTAAIWRYILGDYQVLKKWLSYRERTVLDRMLIPEDVQYFTSIVRRITVILLATTSDISLVMRQWLDHYRRRNSLVL